MATKHQNMQKIIRLYKDETGKSEVDMKEVARFAVRKKLLPHPKPFDPMDGLTKEFSKAAREEMNTVPMISIKSKL